MSDLQKEFNEQLRQANRSTLVVIVTPPPNVVLRAATFLPALLSQVAAPEVIGTEGLDRAPGRSVKVVLANDSVAARLLAAPLRVGDVELVFRRVVAPVAAPTHRYHLRRVPRVSGDLLSPLLGQFGQVVKLVLSPGPVPDFGNRDLTIQEKDGKPLPLSLPVLPGVRLECFPFGSCRRCGLRGHKPGVCPSPSVPSVAAVTASLAGLFSPSSSATPPMPLPGLPGRKRGPPPSSAGSAPSEADSAAPPTVVRSRKGRVASSASTVPLSPAPPSSAEVDPLLGDQPMEEADASPSAGSPAAPAKKDEGKKKAD
ncbi:hypothetical protein BD560DRAFT_442257 [Blakeslea trispora]|nr:hypothetical protein BD560DRAFT_442257 [Blakeslea trispora]